MLTIYQMNWLRSQLSHSLSNDVHDMNLPPTNTKFRHSSMMVSLSTGDLAPNKVPCAYRQNTNEPKHWRSLCDTCDDSCVHMTWHVILLTHLWCFWHIGLAMGLKSPTKCYMVSRAAHWTQQSSHCIDRNHDSLFGLRSCQKHVTSHTISAKDFYTSMGIPLASWNKQLLSSHQILPILSTSSGIMSMWPVVQDPSFTRFTVTTMGPLSFDQCHRCCLCLFG